MSSKSIESIPEVIAYRAAQAEAKDRAHDFLVRTSGPRTEGSTDVAGRLLTNARNREAAARLAAIARARTGR